MTLPEAREALLALAKQLHPYYAWQVRYLISEGMYKRKPTRKAPARREPKLTRSQVVSYFSAHPTANMQDAAEHFRTNMRNVSITLNGKRK